MMIGLCKASNGILENNVSNSKQMPKSNGGKEALLIIEELSKISKRELARTDGSASLLVAGMVEGMSKRLASLASKMSISSTDIGDAERSLVEGRDGYIGIEEVVEMSLAMSIVLATSKSREEGLELDGDCGQRICELPMSSLGVLAITEDEVITGISSGRKGAARTIGRMNWVEMKVK